MKLAFKVGEAGHEENCQEIDDLEDSDDDGDNVDEKKKEREDTEEDTNPGFLRRARRTLRKKIGTNLTNAEAWEKVEEALSKIPESHHPPLALTASQLLVIKKDEKEEEGAKMKVRSFSGPQETEHFSKQIRLKSKMFDSHMPWGYNALFSEYGVDSDKAKSISLDVLNKGNSQLVMGRRGEEKEREEKTIVKDVKKVVKEEEMAVLKEVARMEQMPEVKKSAGGLYPDLSLLTDT